MLEFKEILEIIGGLISFVGDHPTSSTVSNDLGAMTAMKALNISRRLIVARRTAADSGAAK